MTRTARISATLLGALVLLGAVAPVAGARTRKGLRDPSGNIQMSDSTLNACTAASQSQACIASALADIDTARAAEGVGPMRLPSDFALLTVPQQLIVIVNLERTARGLPAAHGPSQSLDRDAVAGAQQIADPAIPSPLGGLMFASLLSYGYESPLEADFAWMYDDGPGGPNSECAHAGLTACWGHRHGILWNYPPPIAIGSAAIDVSGEQSMTVALLGGAGL
jgi:hypothetical protein